MSLSEGTYRPPRATLQASITFAEVLQAPARILTVEKFAGTAVGRARIAFPSLYASDATVGLGERASVYLDGTLIFRGVVSIVPLEIDYGRDMLEVILSDDKWQLMRFTVGQFGIGTIEVVDDRYDESGFTDVGHEVTFNKNGRPNKMPGDLDFSTANDAEWWTLKDCMRFIFRHYVDEDDARVSAGDLDGDYSRIPTHLACNGMPAIQAIDTIAALAGESWGLKPLSGYSEFRRVRPGEGTARYARFFVPKAGAKVTSADRWTGRRLSCESSIGNCRDRHQAVSAPVVKETTYSNFSIVPEVDPLLVRLEDFTDKKYAARFTVDVTKYDQHGLGASYRSGARAKPWMTKLLTRLSSDGSAYLTAAQLASNPALLQNPRVDVSVWVSADQDIANAQLCSGGYTIDCDHAHIDFEAELDVVQAGGGTAALTIDDWDEAGVWLTVATVLEFPEYAQSEDEDSYLPSEFFNLIAKSDLVPERRAAVKLPDLESANVHAIATVAATEEQYVSVTTQLEAEVEAAVRWSPEIETPLTVYLPFMPTAEIGDQLTISGRNVKATGDEVITEITYNCDREFATELRATNVMSGVDASQIARAHE